jgi:quercetin dioxygenase-like cupin family protein
VHTAVALRVSEDRSKGKGEKQVLRCAQDDKYFGMLERMISIENAEHYTWDEGCDGWHLVRTAAVSVIQERMPAGAREQRHFHQRARQFFYVLEGELTMEIGGAAQVLARGQGVEIAPGVAHQAINASASDVRFMVTSVPPSHGDRVEA